MLALVCVYTIELFQINSMRAQIKDNGYTHAPGPKGRTGQGINEIAQVYS